MASKCAKASNAWLRRQFKRINRQFFDGKLNPETIVRFGDTEYLGEAGFASKMYDEKMDKMFCTVRFLPEIVISRKIQWAQSLVGPTLVHEMVHIEHPEWSKHGGVFERRLEQLVSKGAMRQWL